jgi:hypothetical protein
MKKLLVFLLASVAHAQQLDLSALEKLSGKARESSMVTLDATKLKFAAQFLSSEDESQIKAKDLISGLRGVFVRIFEFDRNGEYSQGDLDPIRKQLTGPGWSNIISVKERDESSEVWLFSKGEVMDGIAVIAAEPNEVTVVNIVGKVDINTLSNLTGSFGIPNIGRELMRKSQPRPPAREKPPARTPKRENEDEED